MTGPEFAYRFSRAFWRSVGLTLALGFALGLMSCAATQAVWTCATHPRDCN